MGYCRLFQCWLLWLVFLQLICFSFRLVVKVRYGFLVLLPVRLWLRSTSACRSLPLFLRLSKLFEFAWWYLSNNCHTFSLWRCKLLLILNYDFGNWFLLLRLIVMNYCFYFSLTLFYMVSHITRLGMLQESKCLHIWIWIRLILLCDIVLFTDISVSSWLMKNVRWHLLN